MIIQYCHVSFFQINWSWHIWLIKSSRLTIWLSRVKKIHFYHVILYNDIAITLLIFLPPYFPINRMFKPLIGFKMLPMKVLFIESKECKKKRSYSEICHSETYIGVSYCGVIVVCMCLLENQSNFLLFLFRVFVTRKYIDSLNDD